MFSDAALAAYTKRKYDPSFIENSMTSVSDSTLKAIKKATDGDGENFSWLTDMDDSFVVGGTFAIAQAAAAANPNTVGKKFLSDWNTLPGVAQVPTSIIEKTRTRDGAWQNAVDVALQKAINSFAHTNAVLLQGYGWGEISTIASVSGSTFVPGNRSDITKYVVGMPLHFSQSLHGHVLRTTTVIYVTGVNYDVGSELVTCNAAVAPGANGDYAFIAGLREDSATPNRIANTGLGAWFPNRLTDMGDATITTLLGQSRASNSRYYGMFVDATGGGSVLSACQNACQRAVTLGNAKAVEMFCSEAVWNSAVAETSSLVRYTDNPQVKSVGARRLLVYADGQAEGHLQVSRTTNDNQIWFYDPASIVLRSIGAAPHIDSKNGVEMVHQATALGYEWRWIQMALLQFRNPAAGGRIQLV
jgi:hypothetical protein